MRQRAGSGKKAFDPLAAIQNKNRSNSSYSYSSFFSSSVPSSRPVRSFDHLHPQEPHSHPPHPGPYQHHQHHRRYEMAGIHTSTDVQTRLSDLWRALLNLAQAVVSLIVVQNIHIIPLHLAVSFLCSLLMTASVWMKWLSPFLACIIELVVFASTYYAFVQVERLFISEDAWRVSLPPSHLLHEYELTSPETGEEKKNKKFSFEDNLVKGDHIPIVDAVEVKEKEKEKEKGTEAETETETAVEEEEPIPFPQIPVIYRVLRSNNLKDRHSQRVYANTLSPISIENEHFQGKIIIRSKCDPCPAHLREFFLEDPVNDKLHFEMLVQGQVKRNTQGTVYFGLEIPGERLGLSFFFQGVLSVLLKVGASVIPGLHYDWGSKDASDEDAQAPHCVFPLSTLQQKLIITPQSHCAPPMGAKSFPMFIHNTPLSPRMQLTVDNVYSFSIRSKSLDFASWKAVDVRGFGDFDLQSVWGDRPLQFVAYELEDGANNHLHSARAGQSEGDTGAEEEAPTVEHRRKLKKYLFRIDVSKDTLFQKNESQKCR